MVQHGRRRKCTGRVTGRKRILAAVGPGTVGGEFEAVRDDPADNLRAQQVRPEPTYVRIPQRPAAQVNRETGGRVHRAFAEQVTGLEEPVRFVDLLRDVVVVWVHSKAGGAGGAENHQTRRLRQPAEVARQLGEYRSERLRPG